MKRYINCSAHPSSEGNVLAGENQTALFDCGMAFCAGETIQNVKNALNRAYRAAGRGLDYLFISHTHYDHIGALPFFRKEWPSLRLVTSNTGAGVLLKDTPRRVIRELSASAAVKYSTGPVASYDNDAFYADIIVREGDVINLGGLSVQILETPGHTRDALCFFIPELELLILNETPGVLLPDGSVYPCYLTSYNDTVNSIEKCRRLPFKYLSLPHRGVVCGDLVNGFFDKTMSANSACRDFILSIAGNCASEGEMLEAFLTKYGSETLFSYKPKEAFVANARATIACTLREFPR